MIGIIGALEAEVAGLRALLEEAVTKKVGGIEFVSGKIGGVEVVSARCGVGKVFAAMCTQAMILEYSPEVIINTGVAGALSPELEIGDIIIAQSVCQHDMDTSALGDPAGMVSGVNMIYFPADENTSLKLIECSQQMKAAKKRGIIATGDKFISDAKEKDTLYKRFGASACDMEGAAIGQVCYVNGVPFCVVRAISDTANGQAALDYNRFASEVALCSAAVLAKFVRTCVSERN